MALADETDPVQAVLEALAASVAGDYGNANGKPGRIDRSGDYSPGDKANYEAGDALYAYAIGPGDKVPLDGSGDRKIETRQVGVEVWTLAGESVAEALATDVENVLDSYWTDNSTNTAWTTVRAIDAADRSHETFADETQGMHDTHLVTIELMRSYPVGSA